MVSLFKIELLGATASLVSNVKFWCIENILNKWDYDIILHAEPKKQTLIMYFSNEEDLTLFKFRWLG